MFEACSTCGLVVSLAGVRRLECPFNAFRVGDAATGNLHGRNGLVPTAGMCR